MFFLRVLKNLWHRSEDLDMNWLKSATLPVSFCMSFLHFGESILSTDQICLGFASMPLLVTMYLRNLPNVIQKTNFVGLSFMLYLRSTLNDYFRWLIWFSAQSDLISISSIYTSIVLPSRSWNILLTRRYYVVPMFLSPNSMTL